jgi:hypothetical protein
MSMTVDRDGLCFDPADADVVDVLFDGRRVWSFPSDELEVDSDGRASVAWPTAIHDHLDGMATVELREHSSGRTIDQAEHRFGASSERVRIVDAAGRPLVVTKWNRLNRPFEVLERTVVEEYLDRVEDVLHTLSDECGLPAFLSYGSLLGAVREGRLIGHDVDVDLGYLTSYTDPVDAAAESFRIERTMRRKGWRTQRQGAGFFAVHFREPGGGWRNVDIFTCIQVGDSIYQVNDVGVVADRSVVLPLGTVELEGRRLPAPARPTVFFEAAYGTGWRVPDPSFSFSTPETTTRPLTGWFGGMQGRRDFWTRFYQGSGHLVPRTPTDFARWVARREEPSRLLEVGFGNGRDALFFAEHGYDVHGIEVVGRQVRQVNRAGRRRGLPVAMDLRNLESMRETLSAAALYSRTVSPRLVYGRFLLNAISDDGRASFLRLASMLLRGGGRCYLEFRTTEDARLPKEFGDHHRYYLDPDRVAREAHSLGATVVHREAGTGLAVFRSEDPHVARLVLQW